MAAPVLQFKRGAFSNLPALKAGEPGFTTDKYDLYVGLDNNSANNRFFGSHRYWERETTTVGSSVKVVEGSNNGSNFIALKSPDSLSGDLTYTLPGTQGSANSVLTNNGSGILSWGSGSANPVFTGIATFNTDQVDINSTVDISGITTISNTTQSTSKDTGALIVEGGVGIEKNAYVGGLLAVTGVATVTSDLTVGGATTITGNLFVGGQSEFVGVVTFRGGTISIGDANTDDVVIGGEFASDLIPTTDDAFSLGSSSKQWKDLYINGTADIDSLTVSGVSTFAGITTVTGPTLFSKQLDVSGIATAKQFSGYTALVGTASSITETFVVTVASKTSNHRYFGSGSGSGYYIDGRESPFITLLPGKTYRFDQADASNSSHPLRFYLEANRTTQYTTNVVTNGTAGNAGAFTQITIVDEVPLVLHYQCTNHALMGNAVQTNSNFITTPYSITTLGNLSVSGISTFTGAIDANGGADISGGETTLSSATVSDLTSGRVVLAGTSGSLQDSSNLTFGNGGLIVGANGINVTGVSTFSTDLVVGGDVRINGNDIQASDGNTNITLTSNTLTTFSGDIKVGGNDIQSSGGTTALTFSGADVTVAGDLTVTGNDIKASGGTTALTFSGANVTVAGDVTVGGNDIKASDGVTAITLTATTGAVGVSSDLTVSGRLFVLGTTTEINTETLKVEDSLIEVGLVNSGGSLVPPSSDLNIDVGILFNYYTSSAKRAGIYWDDSASRVVVSSDLSEASSIITSTTYAALEIGALWVTDCAGTSQVISCTGVERFLENITVDGGAF